jgi:hypothetical protein
MAQVLGARPVLADQAASTRTGPRRPPVLLVAGVLLALLPIATATARALGHLDWFPVGDNAVVYARTTDVFSGDTPLLYMWSTGSNWAEEAFNNPGPLFYWVLAGPSALLGPQGPAVAVALLNAGAVVGIALVARRRGGDLLAAAAVLVAAALAHSMGSELLYDPWPPNSLLLPFLLYLLLAWSAADGDLLAIPLMAGLGSLLLETNLSYALLVPGMAVWAIGAVAVHLWRERRRHPEAWPDRRRQARRSGAAAVVVLLVLWTPTVIEQLTSEGPGNLTLMVRGMSDLPFALGPSGALRLLAGVAALPGWWFRGSIPGLYADTPSIGAARLGALALGGLFVVLGWLAVRRRDRMSVAGLGTAAAALVVAFVTVDRSPVDVFGELSPYRTRFLWPVAALVTLALGVALVRRLLPGARARRLAVIASVAATAGLAIANLPYYAQARGTHQPPYAVPIVQDLRRQLGGLDEDATVFADWEGDSFNHQYFMSGVLAELAGRDIPFKVEAKHLLRTFGTSHEFTGHNADIRLTVRTGERVFERRRGEERVAFHEGLTQAERAGLRRLGAQIIRFVDDGRLRLTPVGAASLERIQGKPWETPDGRAFVESGAALKVYQHGFLQLDATWARRFARYVQLEDRSDDRTVGVFLDPLDP